MGPSVAVWRNQKSVWRGIKGLKDWEAHKKHAEKRVILDISATREAFLGRVISEIGLSRGANAFADGLIKSMSKVLPCKITTKGNLKIQWDQRIIRSREVTWGLSTEYEAH